MTKAQQIKKDLLDQLEQQGKYGEFFTDLVEDYMKFYKLKNDLQKDIKKNGIRIKGMNGNGFMCEKPNESIPNLVKINTQMLKILQDLDLKAPAVTSDDPEDYL